MDQFATIFDELIKFFVSAFTNIIDNPVDYGCDYVVGILHLWRRCNRALPAAMSFDAFKTNQQYL